MVLEATGDDGVRGGAATFPLARQDDLVVTASGDEVIIYDRKVHHVHHLNAVLAAIWRSCDGRRGVAEIAATARVDRDTVGVALTTLANANLLAQAGVVPRTSRRVFGRRAAMLGVGAIPAIVSVTAPLASAAASGLCQKAGDGGMLQTCPDRADGYCCMGLTNGGRSGVCESGQCIPFS